MNWKKKSVLVTGAGGFIGSHLTDRLSSLGADVTAFVRYNSRNDRGMLEHIDEKTKNHITVVPGDLKDFNAIRDSMKDQDIVFHLGSLIAIPYSYVHSRETVETNVLGALNVLMAMKETGVEKLVHTSTSEVYGTAQYVPIDEKHPINPQSPYAASKASADSLAMSFHHSYDLPISIIRPFNTFGPRQSARAIIPTIITQALTQKEVKLGSLTPTRDFTYVSDTVEGFIKIAECKKSIGEVINIGSDQEISIGELADKIISVMNKKIKIKQEKQRIRPINSEVERLRTSNEKAKKLLNWKPMVALDNGLKQTIEWISDNLSLYKQNIYNL
jgi:NAD dependent epimerase/dehydratase